MNRIARALLFAAFALLLGFHVLPIGHQPPGSRIERGWRVWAGIWEDLGDILRSSATQPMALVFLMGLITWFFLSATSPFLVPLLIRSRTLWLISILMSALCLAGFAVVLVRGSNFDWPAAMICLFASPVFHLAGLLCIRREEIPCPESGLSPP